MSKKILIPLFTICLLASCGDDSASNANYENGGSNLPPQQGTEIPCDVGNEGLVIKPADSENPRLCTNGTWVEILSSSSSVILNEVEGSSSSSVKPGQPNDVQSSSSVTQNSSSSDVPKSSSSTILSEVEGSSSSSEEAKMYLCDDGITYVLDLANCANSSSSSVIQSSSSTKKPEESSSSVMSSSSSTPIEDPSSSSSSVVSSSSSAVSSSSVQSSSSSVIASSSSSFEVEGICKTEFEDNCVYGSLYDERDGQTYKTVKVGDQWWMAENLKFKHSNPEYTKYMKCQLDDEENCDTYGVLYHSKIAPESCPEGWIVPSRKEWLTLGKYVSQYKGNVPIGQALRSQEGWDLNGTGKGYDYFGLNIKPGGGYDGHYLNGFRATTKYAEFAQNAEQHYSGCYIQTTVFHKIQDDSKSKSDFIIGNITNYITENCFINNYVYIRCVKE